MVVNDYSTGKIYLISSPHTDKVYIGSTIQILKVRFAGHKCNASSSKIIIDCGDAEIILIRNFPCNDVDELEIEERREMILHHNRVNIRLPRPTEQEKKEMQSMRDRNMPQEKRDKKNENARNIPQEKRDEKNEVRRNIYANVPQEERDEQNEKNRNRTREEKDKINERQNIRRRKITAEKKKAKQLI
jgi:hypothetical protein